MDTLKRPLSVILAIIVAVIAFHLIFSAFYPENVDIGGIWDILNWFISFGVIVSLAVTYINKRRAGYDSADTKEFICASASFYAAALLALLFFWNWFDDLALEESQSQLRLIFWGFINPLFIIVAGSASASLWKR